MLQLWDEASGWLVGCWTTSAAPEPWVLLVAFGVVLVTTLIRPLWRVARNAVTIVHEMGHVAVARFCGHRIRGIRLHSDTSGLAITRARPRGPGMLLTALAGYPTPGIVGAAMVWAVALRRAAASLLLLIGMLVVALLLVRNFWSLLIVLVSRLGTGLVLWHDDSRVVTLLVLALGLFLAGATVLTPSTLGSSYDCTS